MNDLNQVFDRFDTLCSDPLFLEILQSHKTLGDILEELNVEIDHETMIRPNKNGVYGGGYINGLFFAKRELVKQLSILRCRLLNLLGFEDTKPIICSLIISILAEYEQNELSIERTLGDIRNLIVLHLEGEKV